MFRMRTNDERRRSKEWSRDSADNATKKAIEHISEAFDIIKEKLWSIECTLEELSKKNITIEEFKALPHNKHLVLWPRKPPFSTILGFSYLEESVTSCSSNKATTKKRTSKNTSNRKNRSGQQAGDTEDRDPTNHYDSDGIRIHIGDEVAFLNKGNF